MSAANFEYASGHTIDVEKGYVKDRDGETKFGICSRFYPKEDIKNMTVPRAKELMYENYWLPANLDLVHDKFVASEIFDSAVNCGAAAAVFFAQRACNFLREPVKEDGRMGRQTATALNRLADRNRIALLASLNLFQGIYYIDCIKANPAKKDNSHGWMKRLLIPVEAMGK